MSVATSSVLMERYDLTTLPPCRNLWHWWGRGTHGRQWSPSLSLDNGANLPLLTGLGQSAWSTTAWCCGSGLDPGATPRQPALPSIRKYFSIRNVRHHRWQHIAHDVADPGDLVGSPRQHCIVKVGLSCSDPLLQLVHAVGNEIFSPGNGNLSLRQRWPDTFQLPCPGPRRLHKLTGGGQGCRGDDRTGMNVQSRGGAPEGAAGAGF